MSSLSRPPLVGEEEGGHGAAVLRAYTSGTGGDVLDTPGSLEGKGEGDTLDGQLVVLGGGMGGADRWARPGL